MFKKLLPFLAASVFFFFTIDVANAAVNFYHKSDPHNTLGDFKYVDRGSHDSYTVRFNNTRVKKQYVASYHDAAFTKKGTEKTYVSSNQGFTHYTAFDFNCNTYYHYQAFDATGAMVVELKIKVDGLQKPNCSSEPDEDSGAKEPTPPACDICGALGEMKPAIDKVTEAVKENTSKVEEVKEVVETISDQLSDFHDEFKTDMDFPLTPMPDLPDYEVDQPKDSFKDETIYFKDEGDAPEKPGKMPKAPEPEHWDGLLPEDEMSPDKPLKKDKEQKKEKELEKDKERKKDDEKKKDEEMKREEFKADAPMQQEKFEKSPQMEVQKFEADKFNQTETYQKDSQMNNTHKYDRTNVFGGG